MTAPAIPSVSTMGVTVPYITVAELKRSPVYTQLRQLVPQSSDADRDAELAAIIRRASAMINGEVNQNLAATVDVEVARVRVSDDGSLRIHARSSPIVSVEAVSVGSDVYSLSPVADLSHLVLEPWRITIPSGTSPDWLSSGNLPLTGYCPGQTLWAQFTYVNGFPVTTLSAGVSAGATSITVADPTGIIAGRTLLTFEDGRLFEQAVPTAVNGNVLTVPSLAFAHSTGVGVTALPDDIKECTLLLCSRLHDTWSLTMGSVSMDGSGAHNKSPRPRIMCDAAVILQPYRRMW